MKRPASASKSSCAGPPASGALVKISGSIGKPTFDAAQYSTWVANYATRDTCLEELGCNTYCKSHAARVVKTNGTTTHLRCRLRSSIPPCNWAAILRQQADGSVDLHQHSTHWKDHDERSASKGKRGFEDMAERQSIVQLLSATPTTRPTAALRAARLAPKVAVKKVQLKQVQSLKKAIGKKRFASRTMGQLRKAVAKHQALPADRSKGYYCYSTIPMTKVGQKPKFTVVATTRLLQQRWVDSPECTASADGGFKFNLLGWPLHVIGQVNGAGNFSLCAIGLTSSMEGEQIADMLRGFQSSTARVTKRSTDKAFAMSDAEVAYRRGLSTAFASKNLMCYFHVKQAARDSLWKHLPGTKADKEKVWSCVSVDIDLIRAAQSIPDFQSRCTAVRSKWEAEGLDKATQWSDSLGREYDFVSEFFKQWSEAAPEWHLGASESTSDDTVAPGTNNGAESCVKNTRFDAGNVIGSVGETLAFLLQQVEHVANNKFDPKAARPIEESLWKKAVLFKGMFNSTKIQSVRHGLSTLYCCSPRADPEDHNVCHRESISRQHASKMVAAFARQQLGGDTTVQRLNMFSGPSGVRVFGFRGTVAFCTCPAFPGRRRCFHTLGLAIFSGKAEPPDTVDCTLVSLATRGNKRKAPPRGSVPLLADQKDLRIAELEAQLRKASKLSRQMREVAPARVEEDVGLAPLLVEEDEPLPPPIEHAWIPQRRLRSKTAFAMGLNAMATGPRLPAEMDGAETPKEADEDRERQNAIALAQNDIFLASDPSIGKDTCDIPPENPPLLEEELEVAANGRCLTNCCVAAASPQEWASAQRKDGTATDFRRMVKEDELARDFLLTEVFEAGMSGHRVSQLLQGEYAEAADVVFFARAVKGSIAVKPPAAELRVQQTRYYGEGPLKMEVELYYLAGKSAPHYKLVQSWM